MFDLLLRQIKEALCAPLARVIGLVLTPNQITLLAFLAGVVATACLARGAYMWGQLFWWINRVLDGLDGVVARQRNKQTDFGGYLDIILDFTVYSIIPVAIVFSHAAEDCMSEGRAALCLSSKTGVRSGEPLLWEWLALALLEGSYFVNAASLMMLASILEKREQGAKHKGEITTITMPSGLIEGTETMIFYTLFIHFPSHVAWLYSLFGLLVWLTILQRLAWARNHL